MTLAGVTATVSEMTSDVPYQQNIRRNLLQLYGWSYKAHVAVLTFPRPFNGQSTPCSAHKRAQLLSGDATNVSRLLAPNAAVSTQSLACATELNVPTPTVTLPNSCDSTAKIDALRYKV